MNAMLKCKARHISKRDLGNMKNAIKQVQELMAQEGARRYMEEGPSSTPSPPQGRQRKRSRPSESVPEETRCGAATSQPQERARRQ